MISDKLLKDIKQYCELNDILDIEGLINKMLLNGFNIEKHGNKPSFLSNKSETISNEIIPVKPIELEPILPKLNDSDINKEETPINRYTINIRTKSEEINHRNDEDDYNPRKNK